MDKNLIFSLDIGTRSIIGIVGHYLGDENINILGYSIREHKRRNMYDGQIHDIQGVAKTVKEIVKDLEKQTNKELKTVSIAAAGRALKTQKVFMDKDIGPSRKISQKDIEVLELEAIQKAQDEINHTSENHKYYSIGYTVVDYYLNGDPIDRLDDHRGNKIGVELLATFLPQVVVESLYSVIEQVGLEVASITLEPIAAINIAIKEELRLLNLALVDIGAGTTDIAITRGGQIIAYAMTSTAGDEITEELARNYLLDFNSAEELKVNLSKNEDHKFTDIVGIDYNIKTGEIIENLQEIIDKIALEIGEKIIEFNGRAPSAVFLLGGSSQMPGLRQAIAEELGLAEERVSIRDISNIKNIVGLEEKGPNMITPIGIALEGARDMDKHFITVNFNGEEVKIFNMEDIRVSDLLILTKFPPRKLLPERGKEGGIPQILVNGLVGSLQTRISNHAEVEIIEVPASEVELKEKEKEEVVEESPRQVEAQEVKVDRKLKHRTGKIINLLINGEDMELEYIKEEFIFVDIFEYIDFDLTKLKGKLILKLNDEEAGYTDVLKNGDRIEVYWEE